jgi:hypothetical protein
MAEKITLDLIGKVILETREAMRKLEGLPAAVAELRDDQTVMIRMLQRREAELDLMRALEQRYQSLRIKLDQLERRLDEAGIH